MAGLCEGGNEPSGSLKAICDGCNGGGKELTIYHIISFHRCLITGALLVSLATRFIAAFTSVPILSKIDPVSSIIVPIYVSAFPNIFFPQVFQLALYAFLNLPIRGGGGTGTGSGGGGGGG
ncbi:hypothetical protein ANN_21477, partial [Periplaneta americana]